MTFDSRGTAFEVVVDNYFPVRCSAAGANRRCAAAPSLFYARVVHRWDEERLAGLTRYYEDLTARPPVARVIEEASEYRHLFPLPWPEHAA